MNLIIGAVLGIVIAYVFLMLGLSANKPNLIAIGGGSGSIPVPGRDIMLSHIRIENRPTFFGMRFNRDPAEIDSARLYDPKTNKLVGKQLLFKQEGPIELGPKCTIRAGANVALYVFAKERSQNEYFQYSASNLHSDIEEPPCRYTDEKRDFSVDLFDSIGRRYRFAFTVGIGNQSVKITFKMTWRNRWERIREGFKLIASAFKFQK